MQAKIALTRPGHYGIIMRLYYCLYLICSDILS